MTHVANDADAAVHDLGTPKCDPRNFHRNPLQSSRGSVHARESGATGFNVTNPGMK